MLADFPNDAIVTFGAINNPTQKLGWKYHHLNFDETMSFDDVTNSVTLWPGEIDHEGK